MPFHEMAPCHFGVENSFELFVSFGRQRETVPIVSAQAHFESDHVLIRHALNQSDQHQVGVVIGYLHFLS